MQQQSKEEVKSSKQNSQSNARQLQWLIDLKQRTTSFLQVLPPTLTELKRTANSINNPLFRFLEREVTVAARLLSLLRKNLADAKALCEGAASSFHIRQLAKELHADQLPPAWLKFNPAAYQLPLTEQILDYRKRFE